MLFTAAFVLAALPFLASASPAPSKPKGVSIPISKRSTGGFTKNGVVDPTALQAHVAYLQAKYDRVFAAYETNTGKPHPLAAGRGPQIARRSTGSAPLIDNDGQLWYGDVGVGTPAVTFTIDFDTGSSDFFIPDASCNSCGAHTTYQPTAHDEGRTFSISYADGDTAGGEIYTDSVTVAGLTAYPQVLGSATQYSDGLAASPADGLMGLAWPELSSFSIPPSPFFNTLISEGVVDAGAFGFKLAESGSALFLGGSDTSLYTGDVNWNFVTVPAFWQITMDAVNVSGRPVVAFHEAIIDSGTSLIIGDRPSVAEFYNAIPGSSDASSTAGKGFYTFPCSSAPAVSFTFNGISYTIGADYFNLGVVSAGSDQCVGAVMANDREADAFWIMGDAFMRNVYTIFDFDNAQVGFAALA